MEDDAPSRIDFAAGNSFPTARPTFLPRVLSVAPTCALQRHKKGVSTISGVQARMSDTRKREREVAVSVKPCSLSTERLSKRLAKAHCAKDGSVDEAFFECHFFRNDSGTARHPRRDDLLKSQVRCCLCGCTIPEHVSAGALGPNTIRTGAVTRTYREALALVKDAGVLFAHEEAISSPLRIPSTLIGRHGFAEKVHEVVTSLMVASPPAALRDSVSLVLQNAHNIGKRFSTLTARRALNELASRKGLSALDYEPVMVYLGVDWFDFVHGEEGAMRAVTDNARGWEAALRSILFQRLHFTLYLTLEAIHACGSVARALDSTDTSDWRQRMARPNYGPGKKRYRYCTSVCNPDTDALVVQLCLGIQKVAQKPVTVLAVVDGALSLNRCVRPNDGESGSASQVALRVLRELQVSVYNRTSGRVIVLPMAADIFETVSVGPLGREVGQNVVLGAHGDEALMFEDDFEALAKQVFDRNAGGRTKLTAAQIRFIAYMYYPHVQELLHSEIGRLDSPGLRMSTCLDDTLWFSFSREDGETVVKAAFQGRGLGEDARIPWRCTANRRDSEGKVIPFLCYWTSHSVCRVREPFRVETVHDIDAFARFEKRCYDVLGFFLDVFCPMDAVQACGAALKSPLKEWLPTGKALAAPERGAQIKAKSSECAAQDALLSVEFIGIAKEALIESKWQKCKAAASCWLEACNPYLLLLVFDWHDEERTVEVSLRFASVLNATEAVDSAVTVADVTRVQEAARTFHAAISTLLSTLFEQRCSALYFHRFNGETLVCKPFELAHCMICHDRPSDLCFSPSTFTWAPWSWFLFDVFRGENRHRVTRSWLLGADEPRPVAL